MYAIYLEYDLGSLDHIWVIHMLDLGFQKN